MSIEHVLGLVCTQTRTMERVPQQDNHCDCGLYVLAYTEFFCDANPVAVRQDRYPFVGKRGCCVLA
jgi:Ulp1 family protease